MSKLLSINVNDHTEKKNGLTYLSWAWAWAEVLKIDPAAQWNVSLFPDEKGRAMPAMFLPDDSAMVGVKVTIKGDEKQCLLPVMNHRNQAIKGPDAFAINTAIMRCLAKAISMHGLGLYIYAGEDLPEADEESKPANESNDSQPQGRQPKAADRTLVMKVRSAIQEHIAAGRDLGALQEWQALRDLTNGEEIAKGVWSGLTTPERNKITELQDAARTKEAA